MQISEYYQGIVTFQKILQGEIIKFGPLEKAMQSLSGSVYKLALFAVFENRYGYPAYSLEPFLRILDDISMFSTDDEGRRRELAFYLIALCMLELPGQGYQAKQAGLAQKLIDLLSPFCPDISIQDFNPGFSRSLLFSLKNWVRPAHKPDKSETHNFISFISGDNNIPQKLANLLKEYAYTLNFEFEELGTYQGTQEGYILSKSKDDQLDEYKYATGLLILPWGCRISSNIIRKIHDRFLDKLLPGSDLELVLYLPATSPQPGIRQLLRQSPQGIGIYGERRYGISLREKVLKHQLLGIAKKIEEKQLQCLYQDLNDKGKITKEEKIHILGALEESQKMDFLKVQNRGRELVLPEDTLHVQDKYIQGIRLALEDGKSISTVFQKFCPPAQTASGD